MTYKDETIEKILKIEGGYVNNPNDSGGETNYGVTKSKARQYGYTGLMQDLPRNLAYEIYEKEFWDKLRLDDIVKLAPTVARELADTGINMGTGRAAEFLQRSLNVLNNRQQYYPDIKVDRAIGNKTIGALRSFVEFRGDGGRLVLFNMLNCLQGAFYVELSERREKDEEFIYGWYKHRITNMG